MRFPEILEMVEVSLIGGHHFPEVRKVLEFQRLRVLLVGQTSLAALLTSHGCTEGGVPYVEGALLVPY